MSDLEQIENGVNLNATVDLDTKVEDVVVVEKKKRNKKKKKRHDKQDRNIDRGTEGRESGRKKHGASGLSHNSGEGSKRKNGAAVHSQNNADAKNEKSNKENCNTMNNAISLASNTTESSSKELKDQPSDTTEGKTCDDSQNDHSAMQGLAQEKYEPSLGTSSQSLQLEILKENCELLDPVNVEIQKEANNPNMDSGICTPDHEMYSSEKDNTYQQSIFDCIQNDSLDTTHEPDIVTHKSSENEDTDAIQIVKISDTENHCNEVMPSNPDNETVVNEPSSELIAVDSHITPTDTDSHNALIETESHNALIDRDSHNALMDTYSHNALIDTDSHNTIIDTDSQNALTDTDSHNALIDTSSYNALIDTVSAETDSNYALIGTDSHNLLIGTNALIDTKVTEIGSHNALIETVVAEIDSLNALIDSVATETDSCNGLMDTMVTDTDSNNTLTDSLVTETTNSNNALTNTVVSGTDTHNVLIENVVNQTDSHNALIENVVNQTDSHNALIDTVLDETDQSMFNYRCESVSSNIPEVSTDNVNIETSNDLRHGPLPESILDNKDTDGSEISSLDFSAEEMAMDILDIIVDNIADTESQPGSSDDLDITALDYEKSQKINIVSEVPRSCPALYSIAASQTPQEQLVQYVTDQQETMTRLQAQVNAKQSKSNIITASLRASLRRKDHELKVVRAQNEQAISAVLSRLLFLEGRMQKEQKEVLEAFKQKDDVIMQQQAALDDLNYKNAMLIQALHDRQGYPPDNSIVNSTEDVFHQNGNYSFQDHGEKVVLRNNKGRSSVGRKVSFRRHNSSLELYHSEPLETLFEGSLRYYGSQENILDDDRSRDLSCQTKSKSLIGFPSELKEEDEDEKYHSPDSCFGDMRTSDLSLSNSVSSSMSSLPNGRDFMSINPSSPSYTSPRPMSEVTKSRSVPQALPTVIENDSYNSPSSMKERPLSLPSVDLLAPGSPNENVGIVPESNPAPPSSPPSESNPFKSFKNVFKRKGSKKKRSTSVGQGTNDAVKQHFKKYDLT